MIFDYRIGCKFYKKSNNGCSHIGNRDIRMRRHACRRVRRCEKKFCPYNFHGTMMGQGRCFECGKLMKYEQGRWCSKSCWNSAHPENILANKIKSKLKRKIFKV